MCVCVHLARYLEGSSLTTGIDPFTWFSGHEFVIPVRRQVEGRILTWDGRGDHAGKKQSTCAVTASVRLDLYFTTRYPNR